MFDFRNDRSVQMPVQIAPDDSVLLLDGIFLLRPELNRFWDYRIFLDISFATCLQRAVLRDQELFGSEDAVRERYLKRYIPGQRIYLGDGDPKKLADIVIDNNDPNNPVITKKTPL